jgi:hypothetical protein
MSTSLLTKQSQISLSFQEVGEARARARFSPTRSGFQAPDIYTVQLDLGLEGALDSDAMAAAVQALAARPASLRARFRHAHLGRRAQAVRACS